MNGRVLFTKYRRTIKLFVLLFSLMPKLIQKIFMSVFGFGYIGVFIRYLWLKNNAAGIGENIYIGKNVVLKNIDKLTVGDNFSLHEFSYIDASGAIDIGENVSIAHNCSLISFEHGWSDVTTPIKYNEVVFKPISIGNDVWIGCGVRVLGGSIIHDRVIVAAGSVVKGELESGFIYAGVPAKKVKQI